MELMWEIRVFFVRPAEVDNCSLSCSKSALKMAVAGGARRPAAQEANLLTPVPAAQINNLCTSEQSVIALTEMCTPRRDNIDGPSKSSQICQSTYHMDIDSASIAKVIIDPQLRVDEQYYGEI